MVIELSSRELLKIRRKSTKESHAFWLWRVGFLFFVFFSLLFQSRCKNGAGRKLLGRTQSPRSDIIRVWHSTIEKYSKTDFWQITCGREDERNKDHFVSPSLHKPEENKMAGVNGKLDGGRRWSNGDEWGLGWCKTPTRSLENKSKLPTKQQNEELKVYWWNFLHPLVILTADKMVILFCQRLHMPFNVLTEDNLQWRGFSWE